MMGLVRRLRLGSVIVLTGVWVLLWGHPSWGSLAMGLAVAITVVTLFPMPRASARIRISPAAMLRLLGTFGSQLCVASFQVAWLAIRPRPVAAGRVIAVPLHETDDFLRTVTAELTSLVPGTVVIDLDPARESNCGGELLVHLIDTCDEHRLAREVALIHQRERQVARAFGAPVPAGCGAGNDHTCREVADD